MPEQTEKELNKILQEMYNLEQQRKQNLKEYRDEYVKIDSEYNILSEKVKKATADLERILQEKEDAERRVIASEKKAEKTINDAKTYADDIVAKASADANSILERAQTFMLEATNMKHVAEDALNHANDDRQRALISKKEAEDTRFLAHTIEENAKKREMAVAAHESELMNLRSELVNKISAVESERKNVEAKLQSIRVLEGHVKNELDAAKEKNVYLDMKISETEGYRDELLKAQSEFERSIAPIREELQRQADRNTWRSKELDLGFEKLKNDQTALKRDVAKIEAIKKELIKKESLQ